MKILFCLFIVILFSSCSITWKKDNPNKNESGLTPEQEMAKKVEEERQKALLDEKNWQHQYYEQVIFKVKNPQILENEKQLEAICGGSDIEFKESYQLQALSYIKYKKYPLSIKTKTGFTKKIFVPKGVCREITLFKKKQNGSLRKNIKQMNLMYIYNVGTYLVDVTFGTKFPEVELFVK